MIKFKKGYSVKIVVLFVVAVFFLENTVYGLELPKYSNLRIQLLTNFKEGQERIQNGTQLQGKLAAGVSLVSYNLTAHEKQITGHIVDTYNESLKLGLTSKQKIRIRRVSRSWIIPLSGPFLAEFILLLNDIMTYNKYDRIPFIMRDIMFCLIALLPLSAFYLADAMTIPETNKIYLFKGHLEESEFAEIVGHELAHVLKLPGHILLANAYSEIMSVALQPFKLREMGGKAQEIIKDRSLLDKIGCASNKKKIALGIHLGDVAFRKIADPIKREAVVRKLSRKLRYSDIEKIDELIDETLDTIIEKDYLMPSEKSDEKLYNEHYYAPAMGYIAMKMYEDPRKALQYIYKLGQARDSRELEGFEPQGTPTAPGDVSVHPENTLDFLTRQPDVAI